MRRQEERWRQREQSRQKHTPFEQPPWWLAPLPLIWVLGMGWVERLSQGGRAPLWASGPHLHVSYLSCPGQVSAGCCPAPMPTPTSLATCSPSLSSFPGRSLPSPHCHFPSYPVYTR